MLPGIILCDDAALIDHIAGGMDRWVVLFAINFERCSTTFCRRILNALAPEDARRITLRPFRLYSKRASPWSIFELVKNEYADELRSLADSKGFPFPIDEVEFPISQSAATRLLALARGIPGPDKVGLVLDLSALPRDLAMYLCDSLVQNELSASASFSQVVVVDTPPEVLTSRQGLGPFSVGAPISARSQHLLSMPHMKSTLLIFPGSEGFEAASAADTLGGHNAAITIAIGCGCGLPATYECLVANQAVLQDATALDAHVDIQYFFSAKDAIRVAGDVVDRAVRLSAEFPHHRHAFFVAPFGPKWTVFIGSVARAEFLRRVRTMAPSVDAYTDTLLLPRSQYVSLYSRGESTPVTVFRAPYPS